MLVLGSKWDRKPEGSHLSSEGYGYTYPLCPAIFSVEKNLMRVHFVTRGGPHLASYRLRISIPASYLRDQGVRVTVGEWEPADCHIFSKHWDYGEQNLARESPCPIFDLCDDWFQREHDGHYRAMCSICTVVVSSHQLGVRVFEETGQVATYIPEPYELEDGSPVEPKEPFKVLWFGHSSNIETLRPYLTTPNLLVCTNATGRGIVPYTKENLQWCLRACDVVIIPQTKLWKSANRMVESLRAGRFVVASDIPAYRGFDQYLGDINEGLKWVRSGDIIKRIISGRKELSSFSPQAVGKRWFDCISAAVSKSSVATQI